MRRYNVIVSVPVEVEVQIDAEDEEVARALVAGEFGLGDIASSGCVALGEPEIVEAWELD